MNYSLSTLLESVRVQYSGSLHVGHEGESVCDDCHVSATTRERLSRGWPARVCVCMCVCVLPRVEPLLGCLLLLLLAILVLILFLIWGTYMPPLPACRQKTIHS